MDNRERMHHGLIQNPADPQLAGEQAAALELLYDFNATRPSQIDLRAELLLRMFASVGTPCRVVREISDHDSTYYWRDRMIDEPIEQLLRRFS